MLKEQPAKLFYRVNSIHTHQGLWYNMSGSKSNLIHNKFDFCKNNRLQMPFDTTIQGYLSAVENIDMLYEWFPHKDIKTLQKFDFFIHEYKSDDFIWYEKFNHFGICKDKSVQQKRIILL